MTEEHWIDLLAEHMCQKISRPELRDKAKFLISGNLRLIQNNLAKSDQMVTRNLSDVSESYRHFYREGEPTETNEVGWTTIVSRGLEGGLLIKQWKSSLINIRETRPMRPCSTEIKAMLNSINTNLRITVPINQTADKVMLKARTTKRIQLSCTYLCILRPASIFEESPLSLAGRIDPSDFYVMYRDWQALFFEMGDIYPWTMSVDNEMTVLRVTDGRLRITGSILPLAR